MLTAPKQWRQRVVILQKLQWSGWMKTQHWNSNDTSEKILSVFLDSQATTRWGRPTSRWNGACSCACRRHREDMQEAAHTFSGVTLSQQMELQPAAQRWGSINLIFKLSALKDKLQVTQLPGWTHSHHPWCQASTAQLHWQQLRSELWLPGEPCLAGRSLPPQLVTAARQSLGCSSLLQQQKLCPKREGAVFCMPAKSVRSQMGTWAKGMATSHSRMAQWFLSLLQPCHWGFCSGPEPEPTPREKIFTSSTSKNCK